MHPLPLPLQRLIHVSAYLLRGTVHTYLQRHVLYVKVPYPYLRCLAALPSAPTAFAPKAAYLQICAAPFAPSPANDLRPMFARMELRPPKLPRTASQPLSSKLARSPAQRSRNSQPPLVSAYCSLPSAQRSAISALLSNQTLDWHLKHISKLPLDVLANSVKAESVSQFFHRATTAVRPSWCATNARPSRRLRLLLPVLRRSQRCTTEALLPLQHPARKKRLWDRQASPR